MAISVAAVGECMLELSGGEEDRWRMGFAGDTFNTIWALRALLAGDDVTDYVSAFGDDPFSSRQAAFLAEHGIGTAHSPVISGARPGLYAIALAGSERSFTYWRSDSAARQLAADPAALARSLAGRALVYFSGITLAILDADARATFLAALEAARGHGTRVAFDPNYRPRLWASPGAARAAIEQALAFVDIALPTFPDEQALFGDVSPEQSAARLAQAGVGEIVVKNGAEAAVTSSKGQSHAVPAVAVANPIDTTGAGDAFNGGYLAARLLGHDAPDAARLAHRVAAAVVQVRGALAPFATLRAAYAG